MRYSTITTLSLLIVFIFLGIFWWDIPIAEFAQDHELRRNILIQKLRSLGELHWIYFWMVIFLIGLGIFYFGRDRNWRVTVQAMKQPLYNASFIAVTALLSGIITNIFKIIFGRSRPLLYFEQDQYGFYWWQFDSLMRSFPSGHSTTAAAFLTAIALLFPRMRWICFVFGVIWLSSNFLVLAHWFSDVLAGILVGCLTSIFLWNTYFKKRFLNTR